jgi:hypothetical protein
MPGQACLKLKGGQRMTRFDRRTQPVCRKPQALAASRVALIKSSVLAGAALILGGIIAGHAKASSALCAAGECAISSSLEAGDDYFRFSTALPGARGARALRNVELSDQDFSSFSGVGMIVCTLEGVSRSSTAFLVGAFDIAVTVAHTFESEGDQQPTCVYNSTDSLGQIRERIPVSYIKSQWEIEPGASGELSKDLAVVRLTQPSRYAQRTMPLGRFSGDAAPVVMVGFKEAGSSDTLKRKKRGRVYDKTTGIARSSFEGFMHDMDSMEIAPGAPVIDERTGVIIGIHMRVEHSQNTMITMNDWLEATLRSELQTQAQAPVPN